MSTNNRVEGINVFALKFEMRFIRVEIGICPLAKTPTKQQGALRPPEEVWSPNQFGFVTLEFLLSDVTVGDQNKILRKIIHKLDISHNLTWT